jgi:hypothetical protein
MGVLAALAVMCVAAPVRAEVFDYGAVTCLGNRAVVRFAMAPDAHLPVFEDLPAQFDPALSRVPIRNPATCELADRRPVMLVHGVRHDATAYGANSGWGTPIFTLRIGQRLAVQRMAIREHGNGRRLVSLVIEGAAASFCYEGEVCETLALTFEQFEPEPRGGSLETTASTPEMQGFCEALVRSTPYRMVGDLVDGWPAYDHTARDEVAGDNWNSAYARHEPPERFDLNNDGLVDAPLQGEGFGGRGFTYTIWGLAPGPVDPARRREIAQRMGNWEVEQALSQLRSEGWIFYTGEQTRFGEINPVFLDPIILGAETYLLAHKYPQDDAEEYFLFRPLPSGAMEQVCTYRRVPAF